MINSNIFGEDMPEFEAAEGTAMLAYLAQQGEIYWDQNAQMVSRL